MDFSKQGKNITKFFLPALYLAVMVLVVLGVWKGQNEVRKGGGGPLYRNLMECPAYARRGFDPSDISAVPSRLSPGGWVRFESAPLRISNAGFQDLPARAYLSPWGREAQEFTILIAVKMDARAIEFLESGVSILPGVFLGYIGENWEIYFNGKMIASEMHTDEKGRVKSRRNWRDVSFPLDQSLFVPGTNLLALRILGDPAYDVTGLYYTAPYYLDDFKIIEKHGRNFLLIILCSISGFLGVYFFFLFLSVRRRHEIIYLYYSIFSLLFCIYSIARNGIVNALLPNSDISIRLEYLALFLMVTVLCFFTETIARGRVTVVSRVYMAFCVFLSGSQIFFCNQYGDDVLKIWSVTILVYFSYIFFYDVIYFFFLFFGKHPEGRKLETAMLPIMYGAGLMYACGIFDILDTLFFHRSFSLFIYSTFVVHFGLAVTLLWRFSDMYKKMERSNVMLEETVKERTHELQKASRAKSDFLAVMSHEIRTPLNAVIGLSQIELQENAAPSRDNIVQIHRSGSYLLGIINDILDISKIESGSFELVPVEYESAALLGDIVNLNRVRIGSKPINFVLEISGGFPRTLVGDDLRVKQVLNNLLSNAVKYTQEGTITLSAECARSAECAQNAECAQTAECAQKTSRPALVRFAVRDTGIGIRPEDMEKLFSNYSQLDSEANRHTEGTGLGLPIARNLAGMMGGAIAVESEYGKGSCFTVELVQEAPDGGDTIGEKAAEDLRRFRYVLPEEEEFIRSPVPPGKVLVVDDKPVNLLVARGLSKPYGLVIDTAASGQEAMAKAQAGHYDLIFLDHMMPGMDGMETAAALRSLEKSTPIVALTGNAMRGMKEYYLEHGFDDYISKPINVHELDAVLVKWIKPKGEGQGPEEENQPAGQAAGNGAENGADQAAGNGGENGIDNFSIAVESRRIDQLDHYRAVFEMREEFDKAYFEKFAASVKSLAIADSAFADSALQEQAAFLIEAAQKGSLQKIREALPAFCKAANDCHEAAGGGQGGKAVDGILRRLKQALQDGRMETAEAILSELGHINLDPQGRKRYFALYDLLLRNDAEKALAAIEGYFEGGGDD